MQLVTNYRYSGARFVLAFAGFQPKSQRVAVAAPGPHKQRWRRLIDVGARRRGAAHARIWPVLSGAEFIDTGRVGSLFGL